MKSQGRRTSRRAMTLVELCVVIALLVTLLALGAFLYPSFSAKQKMVSSADTITGALLIAKQQAKRDGLPTGVRLVQNNAGNCVELQYIQQPEAVSLGRVSQVSGQTVVMSIDLWSLGLVAIGDYLELNGGGRLYQITGGSGTSLTVDQAPGDEAYPASSAATTQKLSNYRIYPQPRPLSGETNVALPATTQITLAGNRSEITPRGGFYEVLFSPGGNVLSQTTASGQVFLVVEDTIAGGPEAPPLVVAVRLRSGLIGVYPYLPTGDPFADARTGSSSGM